MSRQLHCPNCGGEHTITNPGIVQLVCQFCQTTLYWGEDQVLQVGEKSILPEDDTRLFMFAAGKLDGVGYQVTGHLIYDHGRGRWHEWFLGLDDGREAWVSEDERKLTLEVEVQPDGELPQASHLQVGLQVALGSVNYTVREIGQARTVGGEGQMPFVMLPNETYTYADCASLDGTQFATLEYDAGKAPTAYAGTVLSHEQLTIDDEKPSAYETGGASHQASNIKCTNCDAAIEVPQGRSVETKVCEYCGAQLDLTTAEAKVLGQNPQDYDPKFVFAMGQKGTFKGKPYEIAGRMLYEDEEGYQAREYLLFNVDDEYLWLAEEQGHYVLNQPTQMAPATDPFKMSAKQKVKIGATNFQFYESGYTTMVYVDGALPWQARSGDMFQYADLIAPPQMFGVETDGNEVEYFIGRYMTPEEIFEAFGIKEQKPPKPQGVGPAQPFQRSASASLTMLVGFLFALLNLGLIAWTMTRKGDEVFKHVFTASEYLKGTTTAPFKIKGGNIIAVRTYAPLNNSWI
ncbi:MAG: DUF4178 domain-containing protein, partial [Deltaproteobacteria bacterium]|nr:DUF4178 domain-containing protein [Deltaproteobacteria bacterium]